MDPGTALGVVSLVYDVTKDLYQYYRAWKGCESDVAELRKQLLEVHGLFRFLRETIRGQDLDSQANAMLYNAIDRCNDHANELRDKLDKILKRGKDPVTMLEKLKAQGRKACYPFSKSTVMAIAEDLESCRDEIYGNVSLVNLRTTLGLTHDLSKLDARLEQSSEDIESCFQQLSLDMKANTQTLADAAENIRDILEKENKRKELSGILNWVCASDYSQQQNDHFERHTGTSGSWILSTREFEGWMQGQYRTLFCPGDPGVGKTIVAAMLIRHLLDQNKDPKVATIYIYLNYKRQEQQTLYHILGALLRQLVYAKAAVPDSLARAYDEARTRQTRLKLEELQTELALISRSFTRINVVIDALDECKQETRDVIIRRMKALVHDHLHLLTTSRPLPEIEQQFLQDKHLSIRASEEDITSYLRSRMSQLTKRVRDSQPMQDEIVATVVAVANGVFLLAQLFIDSFRSKMTMSAVKKHLETLRTESVTDIYSLAYDGAMERICEQSDGHRDVALEALSWVTYARRQLTFLEFQYALAITLEGIPTKVSQDDLPTHDEVISLCAGLLIEDETTGIIRLVHFTAQRYLEQKLSSAMPQAMPIIALKCVRYLSSVCMSAWPCESWSEMAERLSSNPFISYVNHFWGAHVARLEQDNHRHSYVHDVNALILSICRESRGAQCAYQLRQYELHHDLLRFIKSGHDLVGGSFALHLMASVGLVSHARILIEGGMPASSTDSELDTPLLVAAREGHDAVVRILLATENNQINHLNQDYQTALIIAAQAGHEAVAKLLLESNGIDVNLTDYHARSALHEAAEGRHVAIVQLLLARKDIEVNAQDQGLQTALHEAVKANHEAIVQLLLTRDDIKVNLCDQKNRTALYFAVALGHETIVRLLLANDDIDVNVQDRLFWTPLHEAVNANNEAVAQLLLARDDIEINLLNSHSKAALQLSIETGNEALVGFVLNKDGIDMDHRDDFGRTPLSYASQSALGTAVRTILDTGRPVIDSRDEQGITPLMYAAGANATAVVQMLLATNEADVNARDCYQRTPLTHAVVCDASEVVMYLLTIDKVNVNSGDIHGTTPLSHAINLRSEAVVKLLLESKRASIDTRDETGRTPLHDAAESGDEDIMQLLLNCDTAGVNACDSNDQSPLHLAAARGQTGAVQLLSKMPCISMDLRDKWGRTPLSHAAGRLHNGPQGSVVELLLKTLRVDVDSRDACGRTPFSYAVEYGGLRVVTSLLDTGHVDINSRDDDGRTPLSYAAGRDSRDHRNVVQLLLGLANIDVDSLDNNKRTPLSHAAGAGHLEAVQMLLRTNQVGVDTRDNGGRTPLSYAAAGRWSNRPIVEMFLGSNDVDVDSLDDRGRTPLSYAAQGGDPQIVDMILRTNRVQVNSRDTEHDRTPLQWARMSNCTFVVPLLIGR